MRSNILLLFSILLFLLPACASLSTKVQDQITEGDSKEKVISILGNPQKVGRDPANTEITFMGYRGGGDICVISIQDEKVKETTCGEDPGYISYRKRLGMALQGAGNGLSNASHNQVNCMTTGSDGYYYSTCR